MAPPQKELPVQRERKRDGLPEKSSTGLQAKRDKAGPSWQTRKNGVAVGGDDADEDGGGEGQGQQPLVVLVAEEELFTVEAKRGELKRSRFALVAACCKVRSGWYL